MAIFKCKMCGGALEINNETVVTCEYCGTQQTLPKLDDERRANLYDRANHFRRNNEYDKAMDIYEQILNEDKTDAEAYWSLVLCSYGIEYVEDPASHKRIPTVNRAQFTSVFDDDNYKSALKYADGNQKLLYESEATAINEIQKGILAISQKEEPFDVFICYKETDNNGRRTPDSVLANDLYHQLTQEGFKVFFSRITLEDKLGTAYEPYIFAALNSAKVMVVLGTKPEFFNAVWVKNEWSRYLALVKNSNGKKMLIPAYKDMDPYDLPTEFSHLQAQDMSKLGFMQDLIRGIKKIAQTDEPKSAIVKETVTVESDTASVSVASLLRRVFMFLEDADWKSADEYCEKVLDIEPENAQAYLGKLMAYLRVSSQADLKNCAEPFDGNNNYQKAIRFGDDKLKAELTGYIDYIKSRNERIRVDGIYSEAVSTMSAAVSEKDFEKAVQLFKSIPGWKNADELVVECQNNIKKINEEKERLAKKDAENLKKIKKGTMIGAPVLAVVIVFIIILNTVIIPSGKYKNAVALMDEGKYSQAISAFKALDGYKDSEELLKEANYKQAEVLLEEGEKVKAAMLFGKLSGYMDAKEKSFALWNEIAVRETVSAGAYHTAGLKSDGTVVAIGDNYHGQCDVTDWKNIVAVSAGDDYTVGLKSDGTVVAAGDNSNGECDVSDWKNIIAISAGTFHTVGLRSDGTVVAVGDNDLGQCNVSDWKDIVAVSASNGNTVGLKADGTVVATEYTGDYYCGECDVAGWKDIVAISAGDYHTVGLKSDGTVVATEYTGNFYYGQCDVADWTDIVAISAGTYHTVGLKADGTVVAVGYNKYGECDVADWKDIVAISAGTFYTVGLKSDGTVVAVGSNDSNRCDVADWKNIKVPTK